MLKSVLAPQSSVMSDFILDADVVYDVPCPGVRGVTVTVLSAVIGLLCLIWRSDTA